MKRVLISFFVILFVRQVWAADYDFKSEKLYYKIVDQNTVRLVRNDTYKDFISVIIPETVTYEKKNYMVVGIADEAFLYCNSLKSVTIPNSVTQIGDAAFEGCSGLTSITIPNSVTSIGVFAFSCDNLTYNEYDNALYLGNSENPYLCLVKAKNTYITSCTINANTKFICHYAFSGCSGLKSVAIPNSVTSIGYGAFSGCSGLTKTEFASIESLCSINFGHFDANPLCNTHHLYISSEEITELVIPPSVTSIGEFAFSGCNRLASVTIPTSVTSIGYGAFSGCSGLTKAEFASLESLCSINFEDNDANPLYNAHHLYISDEEITELVIPTSVTSIGNSAFSGCSGLTSITIPTSVTSISVTNIIGESAFGGCDNLTYNEYDNALYLGNSENPYLWLIKAKNTDITSCIINANTKFICGNAFYWCSDLKSVTIPNSVTSIGDKAFSHCFNLTYNEYDNALYLGNSENPYLCLVEAKNTDITSCTINANTKFIHSFAFYSKSGCSLTSVTIPPSVTSIGERAFDGCDSLVSVTIPPSVTSIGNGAFYGSSLTINCQVESKPAGWDEYWNSNCPVVWNYGASSGEEGNNGGNENQSGEYTNLGTADLESVANAINIYAIGNTIVVENATEEIRVYNAMGALVGRDAINRVRTEIPVNDTGVYLVKVGNVAKRVMVN